MVVPAVKYVRMVNCPILLRILVGPILNRCLFLFYQIDMAIALLNLLLQRNGVKLLHWLVIFCEHLLHHAKVFLFLRSEDFYL